MKDYISLGPTPPDEACAQVGSAEYDVRSRREADAYVDQLKRMLRDALPPIDIPVQARLRRRTFPHELGPYTEVVVEYSEWDEASTKFAYNLEGMLPSEWDDQSRAQLGYLDRTHTVV